MKNRNWILTILVVVALFLICAAIYFAAKRSTGTVQNISPGILLGSTSITTRGVDERKNWKEYRDNKGGIALRYPEYAQFSTTTSGSGEWHVGSRTVGALLATVLVPKSFEPQTNFSEARLTVGRSSNSAAVANCTDAQQNEDDHGIQKTIGGLLFRQFDSVEAAAGSKYETFSYRAAKNGYCFAVDAVIHSTNIANYPTELGIKNFDHDKVRAVLEDIIGTISLGIKNN